MTRHGQGLNFECPCVRCCASGNPLRIGVPFVNPLDGGAPSPDMNSKGFLWSREGDTFETLTVSPSIDASKVEPEKGGHWHGNIINGEMIGGLT